MTRNNLSKILSLALIILMLLSCIPAPVAAVETGIDWGEGTVDDDTIRFEGVGRGDYDGYVFIKWIWREYDGETVWTVPDGVTQVDVLVVGGGGGGGSNAGGGGGAGGVIDPTIASNLSGGQGINVAGSVNIVIGTGGAARAPGASAKGIDGKDTIFGNLTAKGGGGGGASISGPSYPGNNGGSGGGGSFGSAGGSGTAAQGNAGGAGGGTGTHPCGGGGGASASGANGVLGGKAGDGGAGKLIWGSYYGGGGGGELHNDDTIAYRSAGGVGGGGAGGWKTVAATSGEPHTGGGGGGSYWGSGAGGSGIVVLRYGGSPISPEETPPLISISGSPRSGPSPLSVSFIDLSARSPTGWIWYLRHTETSSWTQFNMTQDPTYQFNTSGIYDIRLTASNAFGSSSRTYSAYIQVTEPTNTTHPWHFRYDPTTGIYTRIWFDTSESLPDISLIWTATLLPIISLLGSLFFVWIWLLIVAGSWLYTQDTTSAYVIGILSGATMAGTASLIGADGAVLMVIVVGFAGAGVLSRVIVGKG